MSKYGHRPHNWFEAIVNKLGGEAEAERFLRGELTVSGSWREEDGVIYFSVTSDGTTGEDWVKRLKSCGFHVGDYAKQMLCSPDFKPTSGVVTEVAVLKCELFGDRDLTTKNIRAEGALRKLVEPKPELMCLICEKFTQEEVEQMGFEQIVVMHEPIKDHDGNSLLLLPGHGTAGSRIGRWLSADQGNPDKRWRDWYGFAFVKLSTPAEATAHKQTGSQS